VGKIKRPKFNKSFYAIGLIFRVAEFKEMGIILTIRSIMNLAPGKLLDDDLIDFGIYNYLQGVSNIAYIRAACWKLYFSTTLKELPEYKKNTLHKILTMRGMEPHLLQKKYMVIPVCVR